jgi:hypothetical protein
VLIGLTVLIAGLVWVALGAALEACLQPLRFRWLRAASSARPEPGALTCLRASGS